MTKGTSFLMRCLALALALVLLASSANLGVALQAFAAEGYTVTDGELVARNYELSEAEVALLTSGMLNSAEHSYTAPDGDLIAVDTEKKQITASADGDWVATSANVMVAGAIEETVKLENGVGTYEYEGNNFGLDVFYVLNINVPVDTQVDLLNAGYLLNQGVAKMDTAVKTDTNLGVVAEAMPTLKMLTDGSLGVTVGQAAADAYAALSAQVNAYGKLILQDLNAVYAASNSKTQFVVENSVAYKAAAMETYALMNALNEDDLINNPNVETLLAADDAENGTNNVKLWQAFKGCLATLTADLKAVSEMVWTVPAVSEEYVNYVELDELVAEITAAPVFEEKVALLADTAVVSWLNDTMKNVEFQIVVKAVDNNEIGVSETYTGTVAVAKDASIEETWTAIKATGVEQDMVNVLGLDEHFVRSAGLEGNDVYTITYEPKEYIVSYSYGEAEELPYGWELTLPVHEDATKSYDYLVNGEKYAQGDKVVVDGDLEISRTAGKAYKTDMLYSIVGKNSGNAIVQAILESGALTGNKTISVRQPDVADNEMMTLVDNKLTAPAYDASYNGLSWAPYSYGATGSESLFSGNTAEWSAVEAKVVYRLYLEGYDAEEIIALAKTLKTDADAQIEALERLNGYYADMATLNKTQLGGFVGMVAYTDLTPGDNDDTDAKNLELREYFTQIINDIINNNLTGTNLTIYNMMTEYRNGGLRYYYNNAEAVRNEIVALSDRLNGLSGDPEKETALAELLKAAGKPEYVEKITNLGKAMAEVKAGLTLPNAAIDLDNDNLGKLLAALQSEGELETKAVPVPYMESNTLTAKDFTAVNVQVVVSAGSNQNAAATPSVVRGTVLTAEAIETLKSDIEKIFVGFVGEEKAPYYDTEVEGGSLDALVGQKLDKDLVLYYEYIPKTFTVVIDGEDQTITVEDLEVTLPANTKPGYSYDYVIDGLEEPKRVNLNDGYHTFQVSDLATLFAGGSYEITRTETDEEKQKAEAAFEGLDVENRTYDPVVDANKNGLMDFALDIINSGYSYIALNNEAFMYLNDSNELEISLQVLINAMLDDAGFGSKRLIALEDGATDTLVTGKIDIGYAANDITMDDFDFALHLSSLPAQMTTVANGLDAIKNYMTFQSNPEMDQLDIFLNLPDPVYEVYLTALLGTSNLEKTDMNAVNHAIAFNFLDDYLELVMAETAISADTYENTLNMMIKEFNEIADKELDYVELSKYDKYYSLVERALNGPTVELIANPDDYTFTLSAQEADIHEAIGIIGIDVSDYEAYMGMVKELKEGGVITGKAVATLADVDVDYEAALIDLARRETKRETIEKIFDYTTDLPTRVSELEGEGAIILLDNVDGDLTFNQSAVLDLNGKTITGNITANGRKLIIVDSSMNTFSGGGVNGTISGDVIILGGTYTSDVSAYLKDGYVQENGSVHNAVYTYENGNIVVNTNFMFEECVDGYLPAVHYLAADLAIDLALNYFTAASLTIEGNDIYAISIDDLVAILGTDSHSGKVGALVDDLLGMIRFDGALEDGNGGIDDFINMVVEDLLDLEGIYESVANGTSIGDYTFTTGAWDVGVKYVAEGDYITAGIVPNMELAKNFTLSLTMDGSNKDKVLPYIRELCNVVVEEETSLTVDLDQPYRDGKTIYVSGGTEGHLSMDFSHNEEYIRMLSVLLSYGNPDAFAGIEDATAEELLAAIDGTTVGEVFTALKVVAEKAANKVIDKVEGEFDVDVEEIVEKITFESIANKVGVELTDSQLEKLETLYDKFMSGAIKILNKLDLSENTTPMSNWKIAEGLYYIEGDIKTHNGDVYYRGYGVNATIESVIASVKIKLIDTEEEPVDDCLWGDANHDNVVDEYDADLVLQYFVGNEINDYFCTKRTDVNGDGAIDEMDADLILQHFVGNITKFPVEE